MCEHEYFGELCALAVSGHISQEEWALLKGHLDSCTDCAGLLGSFGHASVDLLQTSAVSSEEVSVELMRERFLERARREGVEIGPALHAAAKSRHVIGLPAFTKSHRFVVMAARAVA